ncbi:MULTISPECIES: response regulator [unclassified Rhizobium]|uniref:response regulator n=1 Tax=unclassified Rhizobium TaxID=2613769 RepID=UPI0007160A3F|nr:MULTISPECIES: response regulator [unclassified Rhizobium]KQS85777.1 hypothetical protein ASG50_28905 [Rhizobium sp. Leaf386]KQT02818.1 hypothetical protein ASG42_25320 [Rhizobium sp. Leaf391]KQU06017.1 hypothetical protein ASG68_25080 [Rhizobium sp. Leaf453]
MSLLDITDPTPPDIEPTADRVRTVLVVEDEPFIAMDIDEVLKAAGMAVEVRSSRNDALRWLESNSPATAVLDFSFRDGDGLAIAVVLQERGIPVIFCSGGEPSDLPDNFNVTAWIRKPFRDCDLLDAVRFAIEMREFHLQMEERA